MAVQSASCNGFQLGAVTNQQILVCRVVENRVASVKGKILVSCVAPRFAACGGELRWALSQDSTGIGFCFMFGP
jgi:hypothetical protein